MGKNFPKNLQYGREMQDFIINYVERNFGAKFVAGDRNGIVRNIKQMEKMNGCKYRSEGTDEWGEWHGPQLLFKDKTNHFDGWVSMPDEFMYAETRKKWFWMEVKGSRNAERVELYIPKKGF